MPHLSLVPESFGRMQHTTIPFGECLFYLYALLSRFWNYYSPSAWEFPGSLLLRRAQRCASLLQ